MSSWRYQPIWWDDTAGRVYGVCELHFDSRDRLTNWSAEPFSWPLGDDMAQLTNDLVRMLVDAYRWEPVAYADLRAGMSFEKRIDDRKAEALASMVERTVHNFRESASGPPHPDSTEEAMDQRVYIVSQTLGTVHIAERVPADSPLCAFSLGTLIEIGHSENNRQPSRMMATDKLRHLREHPFNYTAEDCLFLVLAEHGTWKKVWYEDGMRWERVL